MVLLDRVRGLSRAGEVVEYGLTCKHSGEPAMRVSGRSARSHRRGPYGRGHCEDWASETATGRECGESATATATGDSEGRRRRLRWSALLGSPCVVQTRFLLVATTESAALFTPFTPRQLKHPLLGALHSTGITMPTEPTNVSRAGITTSVTGERHIPSSVRPDGTVRKEIRVRPGYRPPEDVELYKNRTAEAYKNRGKAGVPGADTASASPEAPSAAANKNAKRREARKKAAATAPTKDNPSTTTPTAGQASATEKPAKEEPVDPEVEKTKDAKKLAKKLRQARELQDKKEKGDSLLPEQFQKVIKINELIRQLESLGFDSNGDKKPTQAES
jgi:partner of Y14 and mago protein